MTGDDLRIEVVVATAVACRVEQPWRHQLLDLLRAASEALDGLLDVQVYKANYAWPAVGEAAHEADPERIDEARIAYVYALCRQVLRFVRDRPSDSGE